MAVIAVFLFFVISLLNYMNRFTTPPVVGRLKIAFGVGDTVLSSLQACFELCYVFSAPIFGFIGDRWSRRYIIAITLTFTAFTSFMSSFVPETSFLLLLTSRAVLGIGEACSTNISPSLIGDMFIGRKRTLALCIYQLGIPLGCGTGFMLSGLVADYFNDWRWSFRLTPLPMLISATCLLIFIRDPERGEAEQSTGLHQRTTCRQDLNYLLKIPSFLLTSLANVGTSFATGSLTFWSPDLILRLLTMKGYNREHNEAEIGSIFGAITIASGIVGVVVGATMSSFCLKPYFGLASDGVTCGVACGVAAPTLFAALFFLPVDVTTSWLLIFLGIAALSCCYVLLSEITLNVVVVTRRATARAYQSTVSHLFGDCASPWLSGLISDQVNGYYQANFNPLTNSETAARIADFMSMQTSLYLSTLVVAASAGLFLCSCFYINEDAAKTKLVNTENIETTKLLNHQNFTPDEE